MTYLVVLIAFTAIRGQINEAADSQVAAGTLLDYGPDRYFGDGFQIYRLSQEHLGHGYGSYRLCQEIYVPEQVFYASLGHGFGKDKGHKKLNITFRGMLKKILNKGHKHGPVGIYGPPKGINVHDYGGSYYSAYNQDHHVHEYKYGETGSQIGSFESTQHGSEQAQTFGN